MTVLGLALFQKCITSGEHVWSLWSPIQREASLGGFQVSVPSQDEECFAYSRHCAICLVLHRAKSLEPGEDSRINRKRNR